MQATNLRPFCFGAARQHFQLRSACTLPAKNSAEAANGLELNQKRDLNSSRNQWRDFQCFGYLWSLPHSLCQERLLSEFQQRRLRKLQHPTVQSKNALRLALRMPEDGAIGIARMKWHGEGVHAEFQAPTVDAVLAARHANISAPEGVNFTWVPD